MNKSIGPKATMNPNKTLKSGDVAKQTGVNVETLRYYEREGLLPQPQRTEAGYRLYTDVDIQKIRFIKRAQELGFTLKEIKDLLLLRVSPDRSALEVKKLATLKINIINEKINALQAIKNSLVALAGACPGSDGTVSDCPIIQCLDSNSRKLSKKLGKEVTPND